jgi:aryl-alcohol dehydrogenase-like predicted oxidoreductase
MALGWCLKNPNVSSVILGASRPEQLKQNLKTEEYMSTIDDSLMARIETILDNRP